MTQTCTTCQQPYTAQDRFCGGCGTQLAPRDQVSLVPGSLVLDGRFRIDRELGQGGMGAVYKATDVRLNRVCALKILLPELTSHPTARRRMDQEARALARIEHPNVVQVRNVFDHAGQLAIELEYMPGGELGKLIGNGGMSEAKALWLMSQILSGLHAIHCAGLVHRDVKAANVLLTAEGVPKLSDLGVARDAAAQERTTVGAVLGSLEAMAPEQIQGLGVDARSDVYACGILLFQLLTARLPLSATTEIEWAQAHIRGRPDLEQLRGKASPAVHQVIARALAKDPRQRPASALAMKQELDAIQVQAGQRAVAVSLPDRDDRHGADGTRVVQVVAWQGSTAKGQALPRHREHAKLIGVDKQNFGTLFDLRPGEQIVGRGPEAGLQVHGDGLSRRHAMLTSQPDGVWLRDLGSVNGTLLNGEKLIGAMRLEAGDVMQVGTACLKFL